MGRVHVLDEAAADELLAPRDARAREGAAHVDLLLRLAVDPADVAAARHQVRAEAAGPLEAVPGEGRGAPLVGREGIGNMGGGLGGVPAPRHLDEGDGVSIAVSQTTRTPTVARRARS